MLLVLVEVSVKVACKFMTATDCSHRATSMLLLLVEVQTTLMEVSVKVACRSTSIRSGQCVVWKKILHLLLLPPLFYLVRKVLEVD